MREVLKRLEERRDAWKFVRAFGVMSRILERAGFSAYEADKRGYKIEHPKAKGRTFHIWRESVYDDDDDDFMIRGWEKDPEGTAEKLVTYAKENWGI